MLLAFIAVLPLAAFSGAMSLATLHSYRAADEARLRDTARALAAAVDAQFGAMLLTAKAIAESEQLDRPEDLAAFERRAIRQAAHFEGWIIVLGAPPENRILAVTTRRPGEDLPPTLSADTIAGIASPLNDVFERGVGSISDLFPGTVNRRPILSVMVPIDREGLPRRALGLSFDPELLRGILARQELVGGTFAAIADSRLRIIGHTLDPRGERVGMPAPGWVAEAIAGRQSALFVGPGWSGSDNVYAMERPATVPGWTVVVAQPASEQEHAAWRAIGWLALGFLAFALGLGALAWFGRREALRHAQREADALRRGRAELERLHSSLPAMLFLRHVKADGTSSVLYRGGAIEMVTGWPAGTVARADGLAEFSDPEGPSLVDVLHRALRSGAGEQEWRLRQPDGSWRWMRTHCRRLTLEQDGSGDIVGYILNISAEREARGRALTNARLASLGEMAAGLAHELKQPLQAISLAAENAQFAAQGLALPEIDRRLERIIGQAQRAGEIIEHLRRFARGTGDMTRQSEVGLDEVADAVLAMVGPGLREAGVTVEVDLGSPPLRVMGDEIGLEQVLTNLLLNARDAIVQHHGGDGRRVIAITAGEAAGGRIVLRVSDTGGGIPLEVMDRLFEPFVTTKDLEKGTGLGLAVCHGLVAAMGGAIAAENAAEGAIFTVTLRAAPAAGEGQPASGNPVKA